MAGKTGTTSPPLVGVSRVDQPVRGRQLHLDDTPAPQDVLMAAAQVLQRKLYGGNGPARAWSNAMQPIADELAQYRCPDRSPLRRRRARVPLPSISGLNSTPHVRLQDAGFRWPKNPRRSTAT